MEISFKLNPCIQGDTRIFLKKKMKFQIGGGKLFAASKTDYIHGSANSWQQFPSASRKFVFRRRYRGRPDKKHQRFCILAHLIYERNVISRAVDAANGCHAGHPRFLEISWTLSIYTEPALLPLPLPALSLTRTLRLSLYRARAVEPPTRQLSRKCSLISIFPRALSINIG